MRTVRPIIVKYNWSNFSPAWDVMPFVIQVIMQYSYPFYTVTSKVLPPFQPNDYLLKTHADKGKEPW